MAAFWEEKYQSVQLDKVYIASWKKLKSKTAKIKEQYMQQNLLVQTLYKYTIKHMCLIQIHIGEKAARKGHVMRSGEDIMENYLEVVHRAKCGDTEAFACLYQEIYEDLYRFAIYTLKNPADAQDIVSDTVTDAFSSIYRLRTEEAFKGWIFRILSNKCKKKLKEYTIRPLELSEELSRQSATQIHETDAAEHMRLRMLFGELPQEDRMIIALHLFAGYTGKEIGKMLHMNENTVRSRESRALKKLKKRFCKEE